MNLGGIIWSSNDLSAVDYLLGFVSGFLIALVLAALIVLRGDN